MSTVWALGDYHRFATTLIWHFGPELVADTGIEPGMRVLDVATGTGNVALRAAQRGASVTAPDITPAQLERGRRELARAARASSGSRPTPRPSRSTTTPSTSSPPRAGAIFAPDHQAVARELRRVTRPGGTIGMINFTPEGLAADFFAVFAPYVPAGPSPTLWGSEPYVTRLFDGCELDLVRRDYVERVAGGPRRLRRLLPRDLRARRRRSTDPRSRATSARSPSAPTGRRRRRAALRVPALARAPPTGVVSLSCPDH